MKIITILLLMISTQALAEERVIVDKAQARFSPRMERLKQCDQIANISKRTIKAAIIGVPIAEVIEKFTDTTGTAVAFQANADAIIDTLGDGEGSAGQGITGGSNSSKHNSLIIMESYPSLSSQAAGKEIVSAIYKAVDQIKTKYGQVRPQDIARLNNRAEQKLLECRQMARDILDNGFVID